MVCPSCATKLPFLKSKRIMICPGCNTNLQAENYSLMLVGFFLVWGLTLTPLMFAVFESSIIALFSKFLIGLPVFFWLVPKLIKYRKIDNAT
jgi:hypothetical protein